VDYIERFPDLTSESFVLNQSSDPVWARLRWDRGWGNLADSYFHAADHLASAAIARDDTYRPYPDQILAPVLFLWRHWLELELKAVLEVAQRFDGGTGPSWGHYLMPIWVEARRYMETRWSSNLYDAIERNVELLDAIDRNSMTFRYPDEPVPDEVFELDFDLREIRDVFRAIQPWLAGVLDARDAEADAEAEMRAYFADEARGTEDYDAGLY
jgi:hypothetical protein